MTPNEDFLILLKEVEPVDTQTQVIMHPNQLHGMKLYANTEGDSMDRYLQMMDTVDHIIFNSSAVCPTTLSFLRLHLFNLLKADPAMTVTAMQSRVAELIYLSATEEYAKMQGLLPSCGVEVESPFRVIPGDQREILTGLGISHCREVNEPYLWEIITLPSYHAVTQVKTLQELGKLGVIPIDLFQNNPFAPFSQTGVVSLHVNLGVPEDIPEDKLNTYSIDLFMLSDMFAYGFCSPLRVRMRKCPPAVYWSKAAYDMEDGTKQINRKKRRLELRAGEFRDASTYTMLLHMQLLGACLFSYLKDKNDLSITEKERALSALWGFLKQEWSGIMSRYGFAINEIDTNQNKSVQLLETTDLQNVSRLIILHFAQISQSVLAKDLMNA